MSGRSKSNVLVDLARRGTAGDVDRIMELLNPDTGLTAIKAADMALGFVEAETGQERISHYLFHGTGMQRNYAVHYFRRREERLPILEAWEYGLVDDIQAFSR